MRAEPVQAALSAWQKSRMPGVTSVLPETTIAESLTAVPAGTAEAESFNVVSVALPDAANLFHGILRTGTGPGMGRRNECKSCPVPDGLA